MFQTWSVLCYRSRSRVYFLLNCGLQLTDPCQVGHLIIFFFVPVEDLLPFHIHLQPAVGPGGHGDRDVFAKLPEEFIRHPRGDCVVLSRYAVDDININFPHGLASSISNQLVRIRRLSRDP